MYHELKTIATAFIYKSLINLSEQRSLTSFAIQLLFYHFNYKLSKLNLMCELTFESIKRYFNFKDIYEANHVPEFIIL